MFHFFDVDLAKKYGVNCAILLRTFDSLIAKNRADNVNYYDGRYWTYISNRSLAELLPFFTEKQIRYAVDNLINEGIIMKGNYNKFSLDRTLWYAFTDYGESLFMSSQIDMPKIEHFKENI